MNYANYARLHARNLPDKICLIERTPATGLRRTLTWKEFNTSINRVANYLKNEFGIKPGDYVMHLQNNSLEWLISYYAIIKLGAVVVPLNFRFVGADIKYAAEVASPKAFILGSEFLGVVEPVKEELATISNYACVGETIGAGMVDFQDMLNYGDASEALLDVADDTDLAMMFTSGTTGKPKPVLHTHYSLNNTAIGNGMSYFVEKNDNYLFFLPLYHSGTMFLWAPFYATGATGTILRELKEPKSIIEALAEEKCTDVLFVVPIAVGILNAIDKGEIKLSDYDLSAWRYMEIGAQPVPFDVMKKLVETLPCGVSNIYGITEGGGGGTFNLYPDEVLVRPGSIGKPTFGVEAKLVDFEGNEVGPEEVGELIFKTPRMMKGYYGNPEMTAATLKDGWLHTGDLLKTDADGYYYIVDRKKDMITSGGENIFPVEIEDALMEHPDIDDVACIGAPDERLVEVVMAIVQLKEGKTLTEEEVIAFAKTRLATYKLPRIVKFDQVMRNPTGKLMKPQMREKYTGRKEAFKSLV
ncbi:MAG: acyl--CoA ligase [Deltaproteobacteria bacterium]|nr:acyl--CoA ligase [Deltaproteobacteria bacterium]